MLIRRARLRQLVLGKEIIFFTLPSCCYWIPCKVRWGTGLHSPCFISVLTIYAWLWIFTVNSHRSKSVELWLLKHCLLKETGNISCCVPFPFLLQTLTLQSQWYKWKQFKIKYNQWKWLLHQDRACQTILDSTQLDTSASLSQSSYMKSDI